VWQQQQQQQQQPCPASSTALCLLDHHQQYRSSDSSACPGCAPDAQAIQPCAVTVLQCKWLRLLSGQPWQQQTHHSAHHNTATSQQQTYLALGTSLVPPCTMRRVPLHVAAAAAAAVLCTSTMPMCPALRVTAGECVG
jgi:hypothetical protein